jgi:hypothetical protein
MSRLPPRARLAQTLGALARTLPGQLPALLEASRFDDLRPALARLADPDRAAAAAAAMAEEEAAWLAELLLARWAAVAPLVLEPAAAILAPREIWLGRQARLVPLEVVVDGLEEGWQATWEGDLCGETTAASVRLMVRPPAGDGPAVATARVRVAGRAEGKRTLLIDHVRLPVRVPRLALSADRRQLLVRDQEERPAAGVVVAVGEEEWRSDSRGLVRLPEPLGEKDATVRVEGVRVEAVRVEGMRVEEVSLEDL